MFKFRLPISAGLNDWLKQDLRDWGKDSKALQSLVGVFFPLLEGFLVNLATSSQGALQKSLIGLVVIIAFVHLCIFLLTLRATATLPQFLLEFDQIAQELQKAQEEVSVYRQFTQAYDAATLATQVSLSVLEIRTRSPLRSLDKVLDEVLKPWTDAREEIFWFTSAYHNFAVYLYNPQKSCLERVYRNCDDRITQRNRTWQPGEGHVGVCFQRQEVYFSPDVSSVGTDNPIRTKDEQDDANYKAMISIPVRVDDNVRGVLVITSNEAGQFIDQLHLPIAQVVAILVGQAIKHGWTKNGAGD